MKWSAGWGSACDPCAKAKTRCIRLQGVDEAKCNRCQSLNISCPQQVRKPRKRRRQTASANTTEPPESHEPPPFLTPDTDATPNEGSTPAVENVYVAQVKPERTGAFSVPTYLPGFHPFPTPTCTCLGESDGTDDAETPESDDALLSIYRTRLSPQFPFVVIPNGLTASELHRSRPFLARAIRMVASLRNRRSMWNQSRLLLRHISDAVFMRSDRSLDLLQGIIVFLGFYHYFCFAHGQFNNLAHMASSMIADMRLDRPRARPLRKYPHGIDPEEPRAMSNDERRALLAVWYINSSWAVAFKKVNSPGRHFTDHMERQLQELHDGLEYESDEALAQLVCGQRMNEMIAQLHLRDQLADVRPSSNIWANLDNLLADLDNQRGHESQHKTHRYLVSSHHNFALLQLLEPHLVEIPGSQSEAVAALQHTPEYFHRKDAAEIALRTWFEDWLTIPVCHFFYMPMSAFLQLLDTTVVLLRRSRLTLLARYQLGDAYPPDLNEVSTSMDASTSSDDLMLHLLGRLASRFEEARIEMAAAHCSEWANDFLNLIAWKLRERVECIEKWIDVIAAEAARVEAGGSHRLGNESWERGGDSSSFLNMDDQSLWFENFLMGGDAFDFQMPL
ncbi:hypothetical protein BJX99DRAFT_226520 [Aspergillus californicus]